jgi:hypothetical protein
VNDGAALHEACSFRLAEAGSGNVDHAVEKPKAVRLSDSVHDRAYLMGVVAPAVGADSPRPWLKGTCGNRSAILKLHYPTVLK